QEDSKMKKRRGLYRLTASAVFVFCCMAFWGIFSATASAHQAGDVVMGAWNRVAGTYNAQGQIVLNVCTEDYVTKSGQVIKKDHVNSNALDAVLEGTAQKTIVIPSGSTVELMN